MTHYLDLVAACRRYSRDEQRPASRNPRGTSPALLVREGTFRLKSKSGCNATESALRAMTPRMASSPYLSDARQRELGELAEFIADEHCQGEGPVDPELILRSIGVTLSYGNYEDAFDGLLEHRSGRFHIYCNTSRCLTGTRKRFTLGHELGHYFIDEHREALRGGNTPSHASFPLDSSNPAEREADSFAASLLAPELRLRRVLGGRGHQMKSVLALARTFDVSPIVVAGRLLAFDEGLLASVFWTAKGFKWKRLSETARRSQMRKTIEEMDSLPCDSPTACALRGEGGDLPFHSAGTTVSAWFPHCKSSDLLMEEAVALGKFGVLTLLRHCPS